MTLHLIHSSILKNILNKYSVDNQKKNYNKNNTFILIYIIFLSSRFRNKFPSHSKSGTIHPYVRTNFSTKWTCFPVQDFNAGKISWIRIRYCLVYQQQQGCTERENSIHITEHWRSSSPTWLGPWSEGKNRI